jgi:Taurine catabolism dioxygenase TauD, TfdA family
MISNLSRRTKSEWVRAVRHQLRSRGYYYEPEFCTEVADAAPVLAAAGLLGRLYIPTGTEPDRPVILTRPSPSAPDRRPFDQRRSIGWHNDFSTLPGRPQLSLSWIRRGDPAGSCGGAWRVASAAEVLARLRQTRAGKRLIAEMSARGEAFGYLDGGVWRSFRVVIGADRRLASGGLRFYRRAIEEGAQLRFGRIPERTRDIVASVEEAADAVGETLPAATGALLIVDNRLSLHDRAEQQVTGPAECRRQAWLCFVKQLNQPL